ncbi:hypothetical protein JCM14722_05480 [Pseudodesulfovibrio portus]|uniref:aminoglycoside N(3)-acetyltransferase n=2 Tax=Pseudodesulfovibrio portus TaxID=231439 RepID=A0ABM8ANN9_9BACT|nr:hypothetical protein JCM14722_05480 [Pseudodesulfovibrio portus]
MIMDIETTIDGTLAARAMRGEETPFVLFSGSPALTARQLDALAARMATRLADMGVRRNSRVLVCFRHSPEMLVMLLGAWKLGAVVLPTDRFIDKKAMRSAIANTEPSAAVFGAGLEELMEEMTPLLEEHSIAAELVRCDRLPAEEHPGIAHGTDDAALCLFTSGSTGLPKGVVLTHRNLLAGARNVISTTGVEDSDRVLCVLTLAHLNGLVTTFITPLASNGSVVYLEDDFTPSRVAGLIDLHACTWFSATPTQYALMVSPPLDESTFSFSTLKFCRSASAPLPPRILREFEEHYGVPIIETMGTTESAGQIFSNPMPPGQRKPGHVGFPHAYIDVRLVDENGDAVTKPHTQGELQIKGDCMLREYYKDTTATAKAYDGEWFKTGDLCEWDEDGSFRITGRSKEIAIYCGLNVSLRAIEDAIHELGVVMDVACVGREHPVFGEIINIYALPFKETGEDAFQRISNQLAEAARPFLPNALALGNIKFAKEFRRSGVGKILKGFLSSAEILFSHDRALPTDPRALLSHVLGVDESEITDDAMIGSLKRWDSLAHVSLMLATEDILGRRLTRQEMTALLTFHGLRHVLNGEQGALPPTKTSAIRTLISQLRDAGYGDGQNVNYLMMGFAHCAKMGIYDPETLLDALIDALPSGAHLVMNAFTWQFCSTGSYHHTRTKSEMGLINELFLRRPGVIRSEHPIYSYGVWGPQAEDIAQFDCGTCWGKGSLTWKLGERKDVRALTYGLPLRIDSLFRANPVVHALEEQFRVPYRYFKEFKGTVDFGRGPEKYATRMYVRQLEPEIRNDWYVLSEQLKNLPDSVYDTSIPVMAYWCHEIMTLGKTVLEEDLMALTDQRGTTPSG